MRLAAPAIVADEQTPLTAVARHLLTELLAQPRELDARITASTEALATLAKTHPTHPAYARLLTIPGFGPIVTAAFLAAVGTGQQFMNTCA